MDMSEEKPTLIEPIYRWHDAFREALQFELDNYKDILHVSNGEYYLGQQALRIDAIVVKKRKTDSIDKKMARIFKTHNVFEYKSETDSLSVFDYNKIIGYAMIYSSSNTVHRNDMSVSFVLGKEPKDLLKYLCETLGFQVVQMWDGISYVKGDVIDIQIIEQKKLSSEDGLFLRNLRRGLEPEDMISIIDALHRLDKSNNEGTYMNTLSLANEDIFKRMHKDATDALANSIMNMFKKSPQ